MDNGDGSASLISTLKAPEKISASWLWPRYGFGKSLVVDGWH